MNALASAVTGNTALPTRAAWPAAWPALLAVAIPIGIHIGQSHIGLSLADEGFHWYGAQRVLAGEVPLRDFQSYDVGRYYWSAIWMSLTGSEGLVALRRGNLVLVCCTVLLAARVLGAGARRSPLLVATGASLVGLWTAPDFRIADGFAAILLVAGLAGAIRETAPRPWATFGLCLGVAAVIGINHALYGVIALGLALLLRAWTDGTRPDLRAMTALALGAVFGYAPVLLLHVAAPGFTEAFVDSIRQLFEAGATNLYKPLPSIADAAWTLPWGDFLRHVVLGTLFVVGPVFLVLCAWRTTARKGPAPDAAFVAAILVAVPYAHYAYSRADVEHAAISILPLLLGAWTWPVVRTQGVKPIALAALFASSVLLLLPQYPGWRALRGLPLETVEVQGDALRLLPGMARDVRLVMQTASEHAAASQSFLAAPYWPGAYALVSRRSPTWEIYFLFPSTPARQAREIERLTAARIGFALVSGARVDDRSDLGFDRTHPAIVEYLARCFQPLVDRDAAASHVALYVPDPARCPAARGGTP